MGILENIRVLDFGRYIAGPWCAALLADYGADVIRIDKVGGSEDRDVMPIGHQNGGAIFQQVNRNKRSFCLASKGHIRDEILRSLVLNADIVIANLPAKALKSLGIDYLSLTAINPSIILTSMSAFGSKGPFSEKIGFDVVAQAMSGSMYLSGSTEPMRSCVSWVDYSTAMSAAFGTLLAIIERQKSGKGQEVSASLLGSALVASNPYLIEEKITPKGRARMANKSQVAAPADMFRTKDGFIVMQAIGNPMFKRWAGLVGRPELLKDQKFTSDEGRATHANMLSNIMQDWCSTKETEFIITELEKVKLPCAEVLSPKKAIKDEHINQGDFFFSTGEKGPKKMPISMPPVNLSRTPCTYRNAAPALGNNTAQILFELGYENHDIKHFFEAGIIS